MRLLKISALFITALIILVSGTCFAGEGAALTLEELIREALGSNPGLMALREEGESARFRPSSASAYPFPRLSYTHFLESVETRLGPQKDILQLMQPVPFPGKLSLKKEIASFDSDIIDEKINQAELAVIRRVKEAYYTLSKNLEVLSLLEQEREILDNIREITRVRLESGRGYQQHLLKMEVELLRIGEKELEYEEKRNSALSVIKGLLDRPAESGLEVVSREEELPAAAVPDSLFASAAAHPGVRFRERMAEKER
ncbi:MAG: TolC family protein, partial [Candidatus Krumholzibacteriota bacterium]